MSSQRILGGILLRYPRATSLQKVTCPNAIQPFLVSSVRGYSTKQPFKVVDFHGIQQLIKSSSNKVKPLKKKGGDEFLFILLIELRFIGCKRRW